MSEKQPWEIVDAEFEQPSASQNPWDVVDSEFSKPAATKPVEQPEGFTGRFKAGFKRSLPETKSLLVGSGAALAGAVGAQDTADSLLDTYEKIDREEVRPLAGAPSFTDVVAGDGKFSEWAGDTLGNFGGQALQSVAAGVAGGLIGSSAGPGGTVAGAAGGVLARQGVKKLIGKEVADMLAERVAKRYGQTKLGTVLGAGAATTGLNVGQEIGIGYTGRAGDARAAGEELGQGDALRAIGWGVPAGLLDTAAEAFLAKGLFKGASADPKFIKRMLAGMVRGGAIEGGTEGAQAFLERMGAGQDVGTQEAFLDYINNAAAGALGGTVAGAGSGFTRQEADAPQQGSLPGTEQGAPTPSAPPPASGIDPSAGPVSRVAAAADGYDTSDPFAPENVTDAAAGVLDRIARPVAESEKSKLEGLAAMEAQHQEEKSRLYRVAELMGLDPLEVDALDDSGVGDLAGLDDIDLGVYAAQLMGIPPQNVPRMLEPLLQSEPPLTAPAETAVPDAAPSSEAGQETPSGQTTDAKPAFTRTVYRGYGRERRESAYNGPAVPILGDARYYANDEESARKYGPNIETRDVELSNPLVIDSDQAWRELTSEAGWKYPNPQGASEADMKALTQGMQDLIKSKGFDGVVVDYTDGPTDMDAKTGKDIKNLRNVFGSPQVITFDSPVDVASAGAAEQQAKAAPQTIKLDGRRIQVTNPRAEDGEEIVMLDADKAERSFRTSYDYVGRGAQGGDLKKYDGVKKFLTDADSMDAPVAYMDDAGLRFTDGRHRFAYLRDNGLKAIPVVMNKEQAELARAAGLTTTLKASNDPFDNLPDDAPPAWRPKEERVTTSAIEAAAAEAATSDQNDRPQPTDAQKEAGNYKKGHVKVNGLDIAIENPAGSQRDPKWPALAHHYGYLKGTVGKDKDHIDVFLTERAEDASMPVFVVDQMVNGKFDEHKVILGAATEAEARAAYKANYSKDWNGDGAITQMTQDEFKAWSRDPNKTKKPAAETGPARDFVEVKDAAGNTYRVRYKHLNNTKIANIPTYGADGKRLPKDLARSAVDSAVDAELLYPDADKNYLVANFFDGQVTVKVQAVNRDGVMDPQKDTMLHLWVSGPAVDTSNGNQSQMGVIVKAPITRSKLMAMAEQAANEADKKQVPKQPISDAEKAIDAALQKAFAGQEVSAEDRATFIKAFYEGADGVSPDPNDDSAYLQAGNMAGRLFKNGMPKRKDDPTPPPAKPKPLSKDEVDAITADLHREFVNDPAMVGKTAEELNALLAERADVSLPRSKVEQLSRNLARAIKLRADELEKQKNRDPAVRTEALSDALGDQPDADKVVAFAAGFDHALSGKTKSTISGENLDERIRGYDAARKWIRTDEGKAWYEGVPFKKLQNTGADLRRHWEQMKAQISAGETDAQKAWKQIERATMRASLFAPLLPDGASPGLVKYVTDFRKNVVPFKEWLEENYDNWYGSSRWRKGDTTNTEYMLQGERYPGSLSKEDRAKFENDEEYRIQWLQVAAGEYLKAVGEVAGFLQGVQSASEAAQRFDETFIDNAKREKATDAATGAVNYWADILNDAGEAVAKSGRTAVWSGGKRVFTNFGTHSDTTKAITRDENAVKLASRSNPLVPPRLDRVTREGLTDLRKGVDMTPEAFKKDLGFADVGFGGWVKADGGQDHLNYAYDAFMDLAEHFGIPANMIGLGGDLHFTIGALGHGKHAAHFQRSQPHPNGGSVPVINVTNTNGDGTVYHEWAHAFDLHGAGGEWRKVRALILEALKFRSYSRAEIRNLMGEFFRGERFYKGSKSDHMGNARNKLRQLLSNTHARKTNYKQNSDDLGESYWGNDEELIARAFEAWALDTMAGTNSYLVGKHVGDGVWSKASGYRGTPYPQGDERKRFAQVLDALRNAVSVVDGRLSVSLEAFNKALPEGFYEGKLYMRELLDGNNLENLRDDIEAERQAALAIAKANREAEAQRQRAIEDAAAAAALAELEAATAPNPNEAMGPMTGGEFDAMFDDVMAEINEAAQETPEAPPAGQVVRNLAEEVGQAKPAAQDAAAKKQERTAARIAADIAKSGVGGLEESMLGLVKLFGGGPGRLQSFPGGIDEDTYKQAKPHFEAALRKFQEAGQGMREFIKHIASAFGEGIKPYLARFVQENKLSVDLAKGDEQEGAMKVATWVEKRLGDGMAITWRELFAEADAAFGGTQAEGKYGPKDAYDAMEAGVNRYIMANRERYRTDVDGAEAILNATRLAQLTNQLPTQTKRTAEMDEFQQFSTVPPFAYMANWVAAPTAEDVMLEPSAGIGGLAVFSHNAGAKLVLNELSDRRAAVLQGVFPGATIHRENAEQIDRILDEAVIPSLVVMNPPFSSTAGRLAGERNTKNGAIHIEQALARLADGGRLVAIVGEGMAKDRPAFAGWWKDIEAKYDVRAVVPVDGSGYAKYGTTFDNVLLVIDKVKPSGRPVVTTPAKDYNQLAGILLEIRNDRPTPRIDVSTGEVAERNGIEPAYSDDRQAGEGDTARTAADRDGAAVVGGDAGLAGRTDAVGPRRPDAGRPEPGVRRADRGDGNRTDDGGNARNDGGSDAVQSGVTVSAVDAAAKSAELTNAIFDTYRPQRLSIPGAKDHPGKLVESAAMASVVPPAPNHTPNLPAETITEGKLSLAQLESVVYAGTAHAQELAAGERRGFFIGDGTGVGKGREIAGIILDNLRQGRNKAVWISEKEGLLVDAKRDLAGVGGNPDSIRWLSSVTDSDWKVSIRDGVLFTTYSTLRSKQQWNAFAPDDPVVLKDGTEGTLGKVNRKARTINFKPKGGKLVKDLSWDLIATVAGDPGFAKTMGSKPPSSFKPRTRLQQVTEWLGADFDGVIVFDEAHNAGNAEGSGTGRGAKDASAQGVAVVALQRALPKARIVYVSATGATTVENLSYAPRLGLWGQGTAFAKVSDFINEVTQGGLAIMELIARDLKQMGVYVARSLSYEDVTYSRLEHPLNDVQRDTYDKLAEAWQVILKDIDAALELTNIREDGKTLNKEAVKGIKSLFWGTQQRFFSQIITAMQLPTVFDQIDRDLAAGESVVIQLVNTNEAAQEKAVAKKAAEGADIAEEFDMSPRDALIDMVMRAFPVDQYETSYDSEGKKISSVVVDSNGNRVQNRDAIAKRDALIEDLKSLRYPDAPLEQLINYYGPDVVAEVTGRKRRFVSGEWNPDGSGKIFEQKRGSSAAANDARDFMDDKRKILVFSDAGGTGFSFHADRTKKNQRKRKHYLLQPGWRADKAVQGFGRTHRTNQDSAPHYFLVATDIPAHKRFLSSIARRLDQLGALTKGQRDTANQGMFSERDNLESNYARNAMVMLLRDLKGNKVPGMSLGGVLSKMGLDGIIDPSTGDIADTKMPPITQILNRMLSMSLSDQAGVFDAFTMRMEMLIEEAIAKDEYDAGMQTLKALAIKIEQEEVVNTDERTGAETKYVQLALDEPNTIYQFPDQGSTSQPLTYVQNKASDRVYAITQAGQRTTKEGAVIDTYLFRGTSGLFRKPASEIYDYDGKLIGMAEITAAQAAELWQAENSARSPTITRKVNLITGAILPVWDRMATTGRIQVVRARTDDGRVFLGRMIPASEVADVRKRFNVTSAAANMTGANLVKAILSGSSGELVNGWKLIRVLVSGEARIELKNRRDFTPSEEMELSSMGLFMERIGFSRRMFVPTGAAGIPIMERLLASKKLQDVIDPTAPAGQFSKPEPGRRGKLTASQVSTAIGDAASRPDVVVLETADDLPASAKREAGYRTAEGYYDGKTVYLVAGNLRSADRARVVLAHELIGHHGMEAITGPELWAQIDSTIARMESNSAFADLFAEIRRRYPRANRETFVKEAIAIMAEKGVHNSVMDRVVAAIRRFIRGLGISLALSDAEVRALVPLLIREQLSRAERFTRASQQTDVRAAPAFSRNMDPEKLDEVLQEYGETIPDSMTAKRLWSADKHLIFAAHELDEQPSLVTSLDMLESYAPDQLLALSRGIAVEEGLAAPDGGLFSSPNFNLAVVRNYLNAISKRDGFFQYGTSDAKSLPKVFQDVTRGRLSPVLKGTANAPFDHRDKDKTAPAEKWAIRIGDAEAIIYVEKNGNRMYLDASQLTSGKSAGAELYAALFNYAYNTGKVFIGDPNGLSVEALYRRTDHMLSAALKFGTTRMMAPHPNQVMPWRAEYGQLGKAATPVTWREGDDKGNIESLILAAYNNVNTFIGVGDGRTGRYSPGLGRYESDSGEPLTERGLELIAEDARRAFRQYQTTTTEQSEATVIGSASVARALYLGAVLRESGSARGIGLLAVDAEQQASRRIDERVPFKAFYSQPDQETPPESGVFTAPKKSWLQYKLTDMKPAVLGAIPMNYLTDFAHKKIGAIQNYIDARYAMETMRTNMHQKYDAVAQDWLKLASVDKRAAQDMADLMHESTIAGIDPALDAGAYQASLEKSAVWAELNARYEALPEAAKALYVKARDSYTDQIKLLERVLVDNFERAVSIQINRSERQLRKRIKELNEDGELTDQRREELLLEAEKAHEKRVRESRKNSRSRAADLRLRFEKMRVDAPYFPLARFGQYSVSVKQDGKVVSFSKFETAKAADTFRAEMEAKGYEVKVWVDSQKNDMRDAIDPVFIADIDDILAAKFIEEEDTDSRRTRERKGEHNKMMAQMRDAIYQRYLESLPDLSMRKAFIHRKKTAGYSDDALRAYTSTLFHGSYQIARLRYGMEMGEYLDIAQEQAVEHDPVEGMILVNEMRRRHEWVMNPKGSAAAQVATTGAFVYYLGANPAHLFLNATQTAMVGVPILGSKYGFGKTMKHLWDAAALYFNTGGDINKALAGDELAAMKEFERSGLLDKTQSSDLAGIGENGVEYSATRQKWMAKISWFFHKSEVFNREVTALAAYRLAREAEGGARYGHSAAVRVARKQTYEIHFDYSNANRPRYMQSDVAKILLVFRNYNINMLYRLFRDINDSLRGESPQARAEARKQLGAMMGMYGLMAGVTGMPFYGLAMAIAGAFDDEDEPFGAEEQFKMGVEELLGEGAARVLLSGVPGTALNVDLRERIGMPNLWFRSPDRELEGRDYYYYWMEQLLGANAGMAKSVFVGSSQIGTGLKEMSAGQIERGVETMAPAAAKSLLKAGRYAVTGEETNLDGDQIKEMGAGAILARAMGFTPQDLAMQYDTNNALKKADAKLLKRRTTLMNRYGLAVRAGDRDGARDALKAIQAFNMANRGYAITRSSMDRSLRLKARNDAMAVGGITMNRRLQTLNAQLEGEE